MLQLKTGVNCYTWHWQGTLPQISPEGNCSWGNVGWVQASSPIYCFIWSNFLLSQKELAVIFPQHSLSFSQIFTVLWQTKQQRGLMALNGVTSVTRDTIALRPELQVVTISQHLSKHKVHNHHQSFITRYTNSTSHTTKVTPSNSNQEHINCK